MFAGSKSPDDVETTTPDKGEAAIPGDVVTVTPDAGEDVVTPGDDEEETTRPDAPDEGAGDDEEEVTVTDDPDDVPPIGVTVTGTVAVVSCCSCPPLRHPLGLPVRLI